MFTNFTTEHQMVTLKQVLKTTRSHLNTGTMQITWSYLNIPGNTRSKSSGCQIQWKTAAYLFPYKYESRRSDLYLEEKLSVARKDPNGLLNKQPILTSKHRNKQEVQLRLTPSIDLLIDLLIWKSCNLIGWEQLCQYLRNKIVPSIGFVQEYSQCHIQTKFGDIDF